MSSSWRDSGHSKGYLHFSTFSYGNGGTKSSKKCWNGATNGEGGAKDSRGLTLAVKQSVSDKVTQRRRAASHKIGRARGFTDCSSSDAAKRW